MQVKKISLLELFCGVPGTYARALEKEGKISMGKV
jgi:hypothetical protein